MAGYSARVESYSTGDTIEAADTSNEFDTILAANNASTGHKHDGTAGEGATIDQLADNDDDTMIEVENSADEDIIRFYIGVANVKTEQLTIQDGKIEPTTNNDIDLGASSKAFKNAYIAGIAQVDTINEQTSAAGVTVDGVLLKDNGITATGTVDFSGATVTGRVIGTNIQAHGDVLDDLNTLGANSADSEFLVGTGAGALAWESGATVRTSLGLAIGTDVQAYDAGLADIAGLAVTDGNIIVGDGANWVAENGATARTSLGLTIGTNVQAYDAGLADIAGLAVTDGNIIVGNGANWVAETGTTARTSLGLAIGTDVQAYSAKLAALDTVMSATATAAAQRAALSLDTGNNVDFNNLALRGYKVNHFFVDLQNDGGTLKHIIGGHQFTALAAYDDAINSPSITATATPTGTDASTAFATGAKISTDLSSTILLDTADITVSGQLILMAGIIRNSCGTNLNVWPYYFSNNVNGSTRTRMGLLFTNATTAAEYALNTSNIASGKRIAVEVLALAPDYA
jgi:hypothetical protein